MTRLAAVVLGALACSDPAGPEHAVRPGTYVLEGIDGRGAPFVTTKITRADGTIQVSRIVYDSVYIQSESTFTRAYALETFQQEPGEEPELLEASGRRFGGSILLRGDEVVLAPAPGIITLGQTGFFGSLGEALRSRIQVSEHTCSASSPCTAVFNHFVDAIYPLR